MEELGIFALSVFASLFAIINPIANVPVFMGLTAEADLKTKRRVAKVSTLTAFVIILVFILLGKYIFGFFGITVPAFRITGGLLLFYVGFELLQSKKSKIQNTSDNNSSFDESVAISPIAIPMLSGPGTIVAAMNYSAGQNYTHILIIVLVTAIVIGITYISFIFGNYIFKALGNNIILVLGKLMGLIVAILGTTMVIDGIKMACI
ncbi:MAG: MarC family protein [Bacteroidales bacterium]